MLSRIPNEIEMDQEEKEAFLKEEKRASYFYVDSNFKTPHFRKKGVLRAPYGFFSTAFLEIIHQYFEYLE